MRTQSFFRRAHAIAALVLMVLFFLTAAAVVAGLVYGGYELGVATLHVARGKAMVVGFLAAAACAGAGLIVAWSLLPRFDRFQAPGPELLPAEHPVLFREIERVAARTGEAPPEHVYLVSDVNAFVTDRGGLMGIGSRRVVGLGLPLLSILTVSELRAVLAHEFGHFVGGDTRHGRWVHKTRAAVARTIVNLSSTAEALGEVALVSLVMAAVHTPFRWFFNFYMRFTQALSRAQEFAADALAVQLEGAPALVVGLQKVEQASAAYGHYVSSEVDPLLGQGYLPPVSDGFQRFLRAESVAGVLKKLLDTSLEGTEQADPFDSHPPLSERVAAAQRLGGKPRMPDERSALTLLGNVPALEAALYGTAGLKPIRWEESARPLVQLWAKEAQRVAHRFEGVSFAALPRDGAGLRGLARKHLGAQADQAEEPLVRKWVFSQAVLCFFTALDRVGYSARSVPGQPVVFSRGSVSVEPADALEKYLDGELEPAAWRTLVEELGVADLDIGLLGEGKR